MTSLLSKELQQENALSKLQRELLSTSDAFKREEYLDAREDVKAFLSSHLGLKTLLEELPLCYRLAAKGVVAIGQGKLLFAPLKLSDFDRTQALALLEQLALIDKEYAPLGGIVGYQAHMLALICQWKSPLDEPKSACYLQPEGPFLDFNDLEVRKNFFTALASLGSCFHIYPIGGAGDRLNLSDAEGHPLPAAKLSFLGRSLLEGLIRDVQAAEFLYYKIFGRAVSIPIALMTSFEKENHAQIIALCQEAHWFGKHSTDFYFFTQSSAPLVTEDGRWVSPAPYTLATKPGGHGMMWHLALQSNIFENLLERGKRWALIRQINNPAVSVDHTLLSFFGTGLYEHKSFGFLSCPRLVGAAEGTLVVRQQEDGSFTLSNIEYTDFAKCGLKDLPQEPNSPYSAFPANTNVLFADIAALLPVIQEHPIPGLLVNLKTQICLQEDMGQARTVSCGRLESAMQNLSDFLATSSCTPDHLKEALPSFIAYAPREKALSSIKKALLGSTEKIAETPEGCLFDLLTVTHELLTKHCNVKVPPLASLEEYLSHGPAYWVTYHPALGPLWQVIAQKIRGGRLHPGAKLQLEIAELLMENVDVDGSLLITADSPLGHRDSQGLLHIHDGGGRCFLRDILVQNRGLDHTEKKESLQIVLHGSGEFFAKDVTFKGSHVIEVPDGHCCYASMQEGELVLELKPQPAPSWRWDYRVLADFSWKLSLAFQESQPL